MNFIKKTFTFFILASLIIPPSLASAQSSFASDAVGAGLGILDALEGNADWQDQYPYFSFPNPFYNPEYKNTHNGQRIALDFSLQADGVDITQSYDNSFVIDDKPQITIDIGDLVRRNRFNNFPNSYARISITLLPFIQGADGIGIVENGTLVQPPGNLANDTLTVLNPTLGETAAPYLTNLAMPSGASQNLGSAIQSFALNLAISSVMGLITGEVPVGDKGAINALGKSFSENLKTQVEQMKQQMMQALKDAGKYIIYKIINIVTTRIAKLIGDLQIKDPNMYMLMNILSGTFVGMLQYAQNGCIDPIAMGCFQSAIRGTTGAVSGQNKDPEFQQRASLLATRVIGKVAACPTSAVEGISENVSIQYDKNKGTIITYKPKGPSDGKKLAFRNLFSRVPFFAQVVSQADSRRGWMLAQAGDAGSGGGDMTDESWKYDGICTPGMESQDPECPKQKTSSGFEDMTAFITQGLVGQLQGAACSDLASGLQGMAQSSAAMAEISARSDIQTGFRPSGKCTTNPNLPKESCPTNAWLDETPPTVIAGIASKVATNDLDRMMAELQNPDAPNPIVSWFRNFLFSNINRVFQGFEKVAEKPRQGSDALNVDPEKACEGARGSGAGGGKFYDACVQAHQSQIALGGEFESQVLWPEVQKQVDTVAVDLDNTASSLRGLISIKNSFRDQLQSPHPDYPSGPTLELVIDPTVLDEFANIEQRLGDAEEQVTLLQNSFNEILPSAELTALNNSLNSLQQTNPAIQASTTALTQEQSRIASDIQATKTAVQRTLSPYMSFGQNRVMGTLFQSGNGGILDIIGDSGYGIGSFRSVAKQNFPFFEISNMDVDYVDTFLAVREEDILTYQTDGSNFSRLMGIFAHFMNQDMAPAGLQATQGPLLSVIYKSSELISQDLEVTPQAAADIHTMKEFLAKKKQAYEKIKTIAQSRGWMDTQIQYAAANNVTAPEMPVSEYLNAMLPAVSGALDALTQIDNTDFITKQNRVAQITQELETLRGTDSARIEAVHARIIELMQSNELDAVAVQGEINAIQKDIGSAKNTLSLAREQLSAFSGTLEGAIGNIPEDLLLPIDEELSARAPQGNRFSVIQTIKNAFAKTKMFFANVFELITSPFANPRRVKLK